LAIFSNLQQSQVNSIQKKSHFHYPSLQFEAKKVHKKTYSDELLTEIMTKTKAQLIRPDLQNYGYLNYHVIFGMELLAHLNRSTPMRRR